MINYRFALLKCVALLLGKPIHRGEPLAYFRGAEEKKKVFPHRLGISDEWTALSSESVKINLFQ